MLFLFLIYFVYFCLFETFFAQYLCYTQKINLQEMSNIPRKFIFYIFKFFKIFSAIPLAINGGTALPTC